MCWKDDVKSKSRKMVRHRTCRYESIEGARGNKNEIEMHDDVI